MERSLNEANYARAIDRDFIDVSSLERLQCKYFFRPVVPSSLRKTL